MEVQNGITEEDISEAQTLLSEMEREFRLREWSDFFSGRIPREPVEHVIESITVSWELNSHSGRLLLKVHSPEISPFPKPQEGLVAKLNDVKETTWVELQRLLSPVQRFMLGKCITGYLRAECLGQAFPFEVESPWGSKELIRCIIIAEDVGKSTEGNRTTIKGISLINRVVKYDSKDRSSLQYENEENDELWAFRVFRKLLFRGWDCMYLKDSSMKYISVNPALCWLTGMEQAQIVGRSDHELFGTKLELEIGACNKVLDHFYVRYEVTRTINQKPRKFLDVLVPVRTFLPEPRIKEIWGFSREIIESLSDEPAYLGLSYESEAMRGTVLTAEKVAKKETTVLLTGESGSGKDYLARHIHEHSRRANARYFSLNCAAIPPELAESQLFGHEKGAFTGAVARKRGLLELAEGGTLLLNEIGELPLPLQAKLLAFLDTKEFTRVGGEKEISVNVRLIAATNKDLEGEVLEGRFRNDLFYRLKVVPIKLPPLRERKEDIPALVSLFLNKFKEDLDLDYAPSLHPSAMKALCNYSWPGNVRELRNRLESALILSEDPVLFGKDIFPDHIESAPSKMGLQSAPFPAHGSYGDAVDDYKRFLINNALRRSAGKKAKAAGSVLI